MWYTPKTFLRCKQWLKPNILYLGLPDSKQYNYVMHWIHVFIKNISTMFQAKAFMLTVLLIYIIFICISHLFYATFLCILMYELCQHIVLKIYLLCVCVLLSQNFLVIIHKTSSFPMNKFITKRTMCIPQY